MIKIEEIEPGFEFQFRITNTKTGFEEKAYTREAAERYARKMQADDPSSPTRPMT